MSRKARSKARKGNGGGIAWWRSLDEGKRRSMLRIGVTLLFLAVLVSGAALGMGRLEQYVKGRAASRGSATVVLVDLPDQLRGVAEQDLRAALALVEQRDWTDDALCRDAAARLAEVGWVERVRQVRRGGDGKLLVSCAYRRPVALVQQDRDFLLVDRFAVLLPGLYRNDPRWHLVQGVHRRPPSVGAVWESDALAAGLAVLAEVADEPYRDQITSVLVHNYAGREDPRKSHIELATDVAGGRIRWGSAPGEELEENRVEQKVAILRENYRRSGRIDEHQPVIDISTFSDRYTIPG